jgi:hypothetical protein
MTNTTTIILKTATRESLKQIGKKGQSYDAVICDLIVEHNRTKGGGGCSPDSAELDVEGGNHR